MSPVTLMVSIRSRTFGFVLELYFLFVNFVVKMSYHSDVARSVLFLTWILTSLSNVLVKQTDLFILKIIFPHKIFLGNLDCKLL